VNNKICIISGHGNLPKICANNFDGLSYFAFIQDGQDCDEYNKIKLAKNNNYKEFIDIKINKLDELFDLLNKHKIKNITMCGGVDKNIIHDLHSNNLDSSSKELLKLISSIDIKGDNALLEVFIGFIANKGYKIIAPHEIYKNLIIKNASCLTLQKPSTEDIKAIDVGRKFIKHISKFDVCQSVIVGTKGIIGVEGIDGTDSLIERYESYNKKDRLILVKFSKEGQNLSADMPTIGIKTIENIIRYNYFGIAIESGKTIILNKDEIIDLASKHNKFIVSI
jgi:DUF1009 family protein